MKQRIFLFEIAYPFTQSRDNTAINDPISWNPEDIKDIIELFEDVEGIIIKPYNEWKPIQYFQTDDVLVRPIIQSQRIAVGSKFYSLKECSKIIVRSKSGEELDPEVVLRVLYRSCGVMLLNCGEVEPSSQMIFYCPTADIMNSLCQVEHRIKGKDVTIQPFTLNQTESIRNSESLKPIGSNNSSLVTNETYREGETQQNKIPPVPSPKSLEVRKSVEYSVSILHDGLNCPPSRSMSPIQLCDSIVSRIWKALTGSELARGDQIPIKWNFILSPTKINRNMPPADSSFYEELVPLGARLLDPGSSPKGIKKIFVGILSDYLSIFSSRSRDLNQNEVVVLICHVNQDYLDLVRSMRNNGVKVMLIYSEGIVNDVSGRVEPMPSANQIMGLRAILPRHYVLGAWEEVISPTRPPSNDSSVTPESSKNNTSTSSRATNETLATSDHTNRKRPRGTSPVPTITPNTKIRGVEESYGSRNCGWCLDYYGDNCKVKGTNGHASHDCWFNPKNKNKEECCAYCFKYIGRKYKHKTINCWNLECPWCRKQKEPRCFHHPENCPKLKTSEKRRASHKFDGDRKSESISSKPSEPLHSPPRSKRKEEDTLLKYEKNISVIDQCWMDERKVNESKNFSPIITVDRVGNPTNEHITDDISSCSWCMEYLGLKCMHYASDCPNKLSSRNPNIGCSWCHIHLGVKLTHDIITCPNRTEKFLKESKSLSSGVVENSTPSHIDVVPNGDVKIEKLSPTDPSDLHPRQQSPVSLTVKEPQTEDTSEPIETDQLDFCDWCWTLKHERRYHGHDECELAPRPKGNTKMFSNDQIITEWLSSEEEGEIEDDDDRCMRCWEEIRLRRYHALDDCPYAPKPKANEKLSNRLNDIFESEFEETVETHDSTDPSPTSEHGRITNTSPQLGHVIDHTSSQNDKKAIKSMESCQLCWDHYRQKKYHDHPADCRAVHKIRKNQKKWYP